MAVNAPNEGKGLEPGSAAYSVPGEKSAARGAPGSLRRMANVLLSRIGYLSNGSNGHGHAPVPDIVPESSITVSEPADLKSTFFQTTHSAAETYEIDALREDSIIEARCKEQRIRDFFKDPYGDGSERWWLAEFALDYMREFVHEDEFRKDGFRQEALHMFDPILECKGLLHAIDTNSMSPRSGNPVLPRKVTYEVTDKGEKIPIPEAMQSIQLLFVAIILHDTKENYPNASVEHLRMSLLNRIFTRRQIPEAEKRQLSLSVDPICEAVEALTFGYRAEGQEDKLYNHGGSLHKYVKAMIRLWMSAGSKTPDRINGLTTRYGRTPDFFNIDQDRNYVDETRIVFDQHRLIERSMKRYPELASYFRVMLARKQIAYNCLSAFTDNHPSRADLEPNRDRSHIDPESAVVDIRDFIKDASVGVLETDPDCLSLVAMLEGFAAEASRKPVLYNLYKQIEEQMQPFMDARYHAPAPTEQELLFMEAAWRQPDAIHGPSTV